MAVAKRWQCCEVSILLRPEASISLQSVGYWIFFGFLVDWGCGSVGFDLDWLVFSSSLVGVDDLVADWVGDDLA